MDDSSCSPFPDCLDWASLDPEGISGPVSAGGKDYKVAPEGGPFVDDFDALSVHFIDYLYSALVKTTSDNQNAGAGWDKFF